MEKNKVQATIKLLSKYITPKRQKIFFDALKFRTRHISVMLENIFQPHNASAVLRSCDAFGVQDIHIIEKGYAFNPQQDASMGSSKWVSINKHDTDITHTYAHLRSKGYKIIATAPHEDASPLSAFDIEHPSVLVFGNEMNGLTQEATQHADAIMHIPMFGFVESFNISVSVAIALSHIITRLHQSDIAWQLKEEEKEEVLLSWLRADVHKSEKIEERARNV